MSTNNSIPECAIQMTPARLSAWRDNLLSPAEAQQVSQHVPTCAACQDYVHAYEQDGQTLQTYAPPPLQGDIWDGVQMQVTERRPVKKAVFTSTRQRIAAGVATAALVLVLLVVLFALLPPSHTSSIAATAVPPTNVATATVAAADTATVTVTDTTIATATTAPAAPTAIPQVNVASTCAAIGYTQPATTGNNTLPAVFIALSYGVIMNKHEDATTYFQYEDLVTCTANVAPNDFAGVLQSDIAPSGWNKTNSSTQPAISCTSTCFDYIVPNVGANAGGLAANVFASVDQPVQKGKALVYTIHIIIPPFNYQRNDTLSAASGNIYFDIGHQGPDMVIDQNGHFKGNTTTQPPLALSTPVSCSSLASLQYTTQDPQVTIQTNVRYPIHSSSNYYGWIVFTNVTYQPTAYTATYMAYTMCL